MNKTLNFWLIGGFALLHALVTVVCYNAGVDDTLPLTLLTMSLTVILCIREKLSVEFTAANIILVNIIGYVMGKAFAWLLAMAIPSAPTVHALSTFLTTELIGWGLIWFVRLVRRGRETAPDNLPSTAHLVWIIGAVVSVFLVRILITAGGKIFIRDDASAIFGLFLSNSMVLLLMISVTLLFVSWGKRLLNSVGTGWIMALNLLVMLLIAVLAALMVGVGLPLDVHPLPSWHQILELTLVSFVMEAGIFSLTYLIDYAITTRRRMETERDKANMANSQYLNLKQQVNPHFLFNSLNILDCMVAEGQDEAARDYIHKLSGVYRYMLKGENIALSTLEDEMEYVRLYADLLRVRFPEGLEFSVDIPRDDLRRLVLTYSVQMLVENATKHNAISPKTPLRIRIYSCGDSITVENNLIPKLTPPESTGLGLKYIRRNYLDRCGRDILVEQTKDHYKVTLPLL